MQLIKPGVIPAEDRHMLREQTCYYCGAVFRFLFPRETSSYVDAIGEYVLCPFCGTEHTQLWCPDLLEGMQDGTD